MPELLLELFSEEIPARMQARGAEELARLAAEALAPLAPRDLRPFWGPRRIGFAATVESETRAQRSSERGPRITAPEAAVAGFLRKHGASREALREDGGYWVLEKAVAAIPAALVVSEALPGVIRRLAWPKAMRWEGRSAFAWVRPLRRILCLLDQATIPFQLAEDGEAAHGLAASNLTEGHRFLAPGPIAIASTGDYPGALRRRFVIVDAAERRALIAAGAERLAASVGCAVVADEGLIEEVAGLVEWPVPLLGRIDETFMDLPARVRQVTMRANQKYFSLVTKDGAPAPFFVVVANIEPATSGCCAPACRTPASSGTRTARSGWNRACRSLEAVTFHAQAWHARRARVKRLEAACGNARSDARCRCREGGTGGAAGEGGPRLRHGRRVPRAPGLHGRATMPCMTARTLRSSARSRSITPPLGDGRFCSRELPKASRWGLPTSSIRLSASSRSTRGRRARATRIALRRAALGVIRHPARERAAAARRIARGSSPTRSPAIGRRGHGGGTEVLNSGWRARRRTPGCSSFVAGASSASSLERLRVQLRAEGASPRHGRGDDRASGGRTISCACWRAPRLSPRSSARRTG
jgi:hypothetical protein